MKKETILSKETIQEQGIDVKITQNDIIDVLVEDQIDNYLKIYEELMAEHDDIYSLIKTDADLKAAETLALMKKEIPRGVKEFKSQHHYAAHKSYYNDKFLRIEENQHTKYIFPYTFSFLMKGEIECEIKLIKVIGGLEFTSCMTKRIPYETPSHLLELVKLKEAKVKSFLDSFPSGGINERKIAKAIKNQFTKEFMKSMSPDFKKSLNKSFKLKLN